MYNQRLQNLAVTLDKVITFTLMRFWFVGSDYCYVQRGFNPWLFEDFIMSPGIYR